MAGCSGIPIQQLVGYDGAFREARDAGLKLYDAILPLHDKASSRTQNEAYPLTLGSTELYVTECDSRFEKVDALVARCDLLLVVAEYNATLLALARGAPAQAEAQRLGNALGSLVGLSSMAGIAEPATLFAGIGADTIQSIARTLLSIRDRAKARAALDTAAPAVERMLAALRKDAGRVYTVGRAAAVTELRAIRNDLAFGMVDVAVGLVSGKSVPTDTNALMVFKVAEARIDRFIGRPEPVWDPRRIADVMQANGPALDQATVAALLRQADAIEQAYGRWDAVAADWRRLQQATRAYDKMLESLEAAFAEMRRAASDPFSAGGGIDQLATAIGTVRDNASTIGRVLGGTPVF